MPQPLSASALITPVITKLSDPTSAHYAEAAHQWRTLGADRTRWTDPQGQRELAAAFLRYHAAKLALEEIRPSLSS